MKHIDYTYYYQYGCADGTYFVKKLKTASFVNTDMSGLGPLIRLEKVWQEGPNGGVKVICNNLIDQFEYGYITQNEAAMKDFMWAKLAAR